MSEAMQKAQSKAVVPAASAEIVKADSHRSDLQMAIERGMDPATISKLMDLQERWEANQAKKAYVEAMAGFKRECPAVIGKDRRADFGAGKAKYSYATTGAIVTAITPALSKYGLSLSWETQQKDRQVTVTCHVTHSAGHRESATLTGPHDESGGKNPIQTLGSSVHYLQRYTMVSVLGMATADMDDADDAPPAVTMPTAKAPANPTPAAKAATIGATSAVSTPAPTTAAQQPASIAAKPAGAIGDRQPNPTVTGPATDRRVSHDNKNKVPKWHKVGIVVNGDEYGTFDEPLRERLLNLTKDQEVELEYTTDGKYRTIVAILKPAAPDPAEYAANRGSDPAPAAGCADDIPF